MPTPILVIGLAPLLLFPHAALADDRPGAHDRHEEAEEHDHGAGAM